MVFVNNNQYVLDLTETTHWASIALIDYKDIQFLGRATRDRALSVSLKGSFEAVSLKISNEGELQNKMNVNQNHDKQLFLSFKVKSEDQLIYEGGLPNK